MTKWVKKLKFIKFLSRIDFYKNLIKTRFSIEFCEKNQYKRHFNYNNKQIVVFVYNKSIRVIRIIKEYLQKNVLKLSVATFFMENVFLNGLKIK